MKELLNLPDTPFPETEQYLGLYPVVDSVEWIERLLNAGVSTLQLRIKDKTDSEVRDDIQIARESLATIIASNPKKNLCICH